MSEARKDKPRKKAPPSPVAIVTEPELAKPENAPTPAKSIPEKLPTVMIDMNVLQLNARNVKTHPDAQIEELMESIRRHGFLQPIVVRNNVVIAGGGRFKAMSRLGHTRIPAIDASSLTEEEARTFAIADNKIPANAGFDVGRLRNELISLMDKQVDLKLTGFSDADLRALSVLQATEIKTSTKIAGSSAKPALPEIPKTAKHEQVFLVIVECSSETEQRHVFESARAQWPSVKCV